MKDNVEIMDVNQFDLKRLETEPYRLDGFRQVASIGSNLMPEKKEITTVILLKGKLAFYYDSAQPRIRWIETRPVAEVFGRPEFAAR